MRNISATQQHGQQRLRRRGAALLIVLGVLLMTVTAVTILLSRTMDVHTQRQLAQCDLLAFDMLHAADAPILHWLDEASAGIVLPPDNVTPSVLVMDEQAVVGDGARVHVVITAFDQLGMTPMQVARSGSPLRLALPDELAVVLDRISLPPASDSSPLGLDLVEEAVAAEERPVAVEIFPTGTGSIQSMTAIGEYVATHNRDPMRTNINTAPRPLLEAAMRAAGAGGLDSILAMRRAGKPASLRPDNSQAGDESLAPRLITSSDCWAFRIDLNIENLKRSWWAVYQPGPDDLTTPAHERWRCVQRLPIDQ